MNRIATSIIAASLTGLLVGCERRDLFVYGDEFHSVELDVDWQQYNASHDPDGMTVWFYPLDNSGRPPYRTTTANVRHQDLYLPAGVYQGVVIDYSPEEFSHQVFSGLDSVATARVESRPAAYQPDSLTIAGEGVPRGLSATVNEQLYGEMAWTYLHTTRSPYNDDTGLYTVVDQPETMALDTLDRKTIQAGAYADYIPFDERDSYQSTITVQKLTSQPTNAIWQLRVRIRIREGYNYMWQQVASISGLAGGHLLASNVNTEQACLMTTSNWEMQRTGSNEGYIAATVNTFGLRPSSILPDAQHHIDSRSSDDDEENDHWWDYLTDACLPEELRLNLTFVLRDHATTLNYHFDVGDCIDIYDHQLVLSIDLDPDITLPYVDAYSGAGFGADVTPWEEQTPIDVAF